MKQCPNNGVLLLMDIKLQIRARTAEWALGVVVKNWCASDLHTKKRSIRRTFRVCMIHNFNQHQNIFSYFLRDGDDNCNWNNISLSRESKRNPISTWYNENIFFRGKSSRLSRIIYSTHWILLLSHLHIPIQQLSPSTQLLPHHSPAGYGHWDHLWKGELELNLSSPPPVRCSHHCGLCGW